MKTEGPGEKSPGLFFGYGNVSGDMAKNGQEKTRYSLFRPLNPEYNTYREVVSLSRPDVVEWEDRHD